MKMLTKEDIKELTQAQKLELLELISESLEQDEVPVSPKVRVEVESRLKTYDEDKKTALPWRDAQRRLEP
jgi:putative addiction module component (TIGR02574 family)